MSFEVRLDTNALKDFGRHRAYFESEDDLLPRFGDLEDDLLSTLVFISAQPFLRPEIYPNVRHEALRVFRYHVWYRTYEAASFVDVFAILHHSSDPRQVAARL